MPTISLRRRRTSLLLLCALTLGCGADPEPGDANATSTSTVSERPMAIWSSKDAAADSPETAAAAAVRALHGLTPVLGEFMGGDSRSGEIVVLSPGETRPIERSLLLLRQLGPTDQWSVLAAISEGAVIDTPTAGSTHPAGTLSVEGAARGFEATVIVSAHRVGPSMELLDQQITTGGSAGELEQFRVDLDLSAAVPGDVVAVMVRGGVGLAEDPGEFSAVAIRISD